MMIDQSPLVPHWSMMYNCSMSMGWSRSRGKRIVARGRKREDERQTARSLIPQPSRLFPEDKTRSDLYRDLPSNGSPSRHWSSLFELSWALYPAVKRTTTMRSQNGSLLDLSCSGVRSVESKILVWLHGTALR